MSLRLLSLLFLTVALCPLTGCFFDGSRSAVRQEPSHNDPAQPAGATTGMPGPAEANERAPATFLARFSTTKGDFVVEVNRAWAPNAADRFYNLVRIGFLRDIAIFRAIPDFMFQFGIHGDPATNRVWSNATIVDDTPAGISNQPGMITFARTSRPNSRSAQMFVNLRDNSFLDNEGFTPFGRVVEGMDVVARINTEYGENTDEVQEQFSLKGNAWIRNRYPNLDYILNVTLETRDEAPPQPAVETGADPAAPVTPAEGGTGTGGEGAGGVGEGAGGAGDQPGKDGGASVSPGGRN